MSAATELGGYAMTIFAARFYFSCYYFFAEEE